MYIYNNKFFIKIKMTTGWMVYNLNYEQILVYKDGPEVKKNGFTILPHFASFGYYDTINEYEIYGDINIQPMEINTKELLIDFLADKQDYNLYFLDRKRKSYIENRITRYISALTWTKITIDDIV